MTESKPVLLSGIKPTGDLHIGNYFGAMRQFVELTKEGKYRTFIFVADYHALNTVQNAQEMRQRTRELAMAYLAVGLDPKKVVFFKQSDVPAHTELAWIFDTITTMPYLMRAHVFKDAEAKNKEISVGSFNYPMLMAADILLYDTNIVPVGQDQKQHIEYARDTAEKFNRIFKTDIFKLPEPYVLSEVAIVPGTDGQKMSKSYGNVIPLFASRDELAKCVMSIVTDSSGKRPKNVYEIHTLVRSEDELKKIYEEHHGNYKILKELLIEDLDRYLAPIRAKYESLKDDPNIVEEMLTNGAREARAVSEAKMEQVRRAIGVTI
ncbi:tryptophan--tRNA ligase [Candidatus Kaiserbacteria bacterium CG_4_8_14_3_um_filter_50_23]|uniref:Tryptophan--tRNA ligase n=1 Tax=Candidatus Kaiserbacteria bacterium CG17_big_fil_post_rev_8_21_14_2_50_51_7 TaxID=1974613 RepID=A0A2M7FCP4_9BACT|nr:MAG: tryptophan--tRNA ligase [Candidatus Kaiserbacteria bacterium CG17_big_fil_post_rev_8_21_14_2_50_51_7]PIW96390.1 MAG: tryptophan--tRNA ligase [Candidatus Kaiserbacteria bacterium CG_4_8_14_3_um_filter_50_23]